MIDKLTIRNATTTADRPANPADRAFMLEMAKALQLHELAIDPERSPPEEMDKHLNALDDWIAADGGFHLIAELGGKRVGWLAAAVDNNDCHVELPENRRNGMVSDLCIAPDARGQGVGRALLQESARRFRDMGLSRMEISAIEGNVGAHKLYDGWFDRPTTRSWAKKL